MIEELLDNLMKYIDDNFIESSEETDHMENYKIFIDYTYKKEIVIDDFMADTLLNLCPKLYSLAEYLSNHIELIDNYNTSRIVDVYTFRKEQELYSIEQMKKDRLFKKIKKDENQEIDGDLDLIDMYLSEIDFKILSLDEEQGLLEKIQNGDNKAIEELINYNLKLVLRWARYYENRGLPLSDLIQAGNEGLLKAIQNFDYSKGNKFSTYAIWWIKQRISVALANTTRNIRVPKDWDKDIFAIKTFIKKYELKYGVEPKVDEIANSLGYEKQRIIKLMEKLEDTVPLVEISDEENNGELETLMRVEEDLEEIVNENLLKEKIYEILDELPQKDRVVIMLRYGLYDGNLYTLKEIGNMFNVTKSRIREVELRALKRLRHPSMSMRLRKFLRND